MTKRELIDAIRMQLPLSRKFSRVDVEDMLTALQRTVAREVCSGGYVPLPGIGVLEVKERKARQGRHPRTGEMLTIPACTVVRLRVAGALKKAVNP